MDYNFQSGGSSELGQIQGKKIYTRRNGRLAWYSLRVRKDGFPYVSQYNNMPQKGVGMRYTNTKRETRVLDYVSGNKRDWVPLSGRISSYGSRARGFNDQQVKEAIAVVIAKGVGQDVNKPKKVKAAVEVKNAPENEVQIAIVNNVNNVKKVAKEAKKIARYQAKAADMPDIKKVVINVDLLNNLKNLKNNIDEAVKIANLPQAKPSDKKNVPPKVPLPDLKDLQNKVNNALKEVDMPKANAAKMPDVKKVDVDQLINKLDIVLVDVDDLFKKHQKKINDFKDVLYPMREELAKRGKAPEKEVKKDAGKEPKAEYMDVLYPMRMELQKKKLQKVLQDVVDLGKVTPAQAAKMPPAKKVEIKQDQVDNLKEIKRDLDEALRIANLPQAEARKMPQIQKANLSVHVDQLKKAKDKLDELIRENNLPKAKAAQMKEIQKMDLTLDLVSMEILGELIANAIEVADKAHAKRIIKFEKIEHKPQKIEKMEDLRRRALIIGEQPKPIPQQAVNVSGPKQYQLKEEQLKGAQKAKRIYQAQMAQPKKVPKAAGPTRGDIIKLKRRQREAQEAIDAMCPESMAYPNLPPGFRKQHKAHLNKFLGKDLSGDGTLEIMGYNYNYNNFCPTDRPILTKENKAYCCKYHERVLKQGLKPVKIQKSMEPAKKMVRPVVEKKEAVKKTPAKAVANVVKPNIEQTCASGIKHMYDVYEQIHKSLKSTTTTYKKTVENYFAAQEELERIRCQKKWEQIKDKVRALFGKEKKLQLEIDRLNNQIIGNFKSQVCPRYKNELKEMITDISTIANSDPFRQFFSSNILRGFLIYLNNNRAEFEQLCLLNNDQININNVISVMTYFTCTDSDRCLYHFIDQLDEVCYRKTWGTSRKPKDIKKRPKSLAPAPPAPIVCQMGPSSAQVAVSPAGAKLQAQAKQVNQDNERYCQQLNMRGCVTLPSAQQKCQLQAGECVARKSGSSSAGPSGLNQQQINFKQMVHKKAGRCRTKAIPHPKDYFCSQLDDNRCKDMRVKAMKSKYDASYPDNEKLGTIIDNLKAVGYSVPGDLDQTYCHLYHDGQCCAKDAKDNWKK